MNKLKQNRAASFVVVTLVYIIATVVGVLVYRALTLDWWLSLLIADATATVVTFVFSLIFKNASVYDPYWSVQPPVILVVFAIGKELTLLGVLLLVVVSFWAIRLTANWAYTFGNLTHQDWRYTMLHEKTGVFYPIINFVGIHMVPTLVVYGCILPGVYAIREGLSGNIASVLFLCLSLCAAPSAWYLVAGAVANTVLFLAVSIPMADKRQSRKDGFAEYKKQTRMLLPIKK